MAQDKMQSFKVGDKQPRRLAGGKGDGKAATQLTPQQTVGFGRIEALLDEEEPGEVGKKLSDMLDAIAEYENTGTTAKHKSSAKRARVAVERTIDLLDYLYRTKEAMQAPEPQKGKSGHGK